jgi:peptidoglycan/xylan/chitin deacetylase (PgdA/CDA1 family)
MTWNDVENLVKNGHEIGSHTVSHPNMATLSIQQIHDELEESFLIIKSRVGLIEHFAFPFGSYLHFNETARQKVFEIGYKSCASAERGCHVNHPHKLKPEELFIRRDHVKLHWPIKHIRYFIIKNAKKATTSTNLSPY